MSTAEADQLSEETRRAETKLRLACQLQRDAKYLNAERMKILRKMKFLEAMKNEREQIQEKLAKCDGLINELKTGRTEMQKTLKEAENLVEKKRMLLDEPTGFRREIESNDNLKIELKEVVSEGSVTEGRYRTNEIRRIEN